MFNLSTTNIHDTQGWNNNIFCGFIYIYIFFHVRITDAGIKIFNSLPTTSLKTILDKK
jgi:hypothetical protein